MIRRATHIILSFLLLVSTIGLSVSKHYCNGKLISTSFFIDTDSCCDSNDCCKNETEVFQLHEAFSVSVDLYLEESAPIDLLLNPIFLFNDNEIIQSTLKDYIISESPPPTKIQISLAKRQAYLL